MFEICLLASVKVTLIAMAALVIGRLSLVRSPRQSARLSWLGLCLTLFAVVTCVAPSKQYLSYLSVGQQFRSTWHRAALPPASLRHQSSTKWNSVWPNVGLSVELGQIVKSANEKIGGDDSRYRRSIGMLILGVGILGLLRFGVGVYGLVALRRDCVPVRDSVMRQRFQEMAARFEFESPPKLTLVTKIRSPCVSWLHPNTIYLPYGFSEWNRSEQEAAWAHELAHLHRHDAGYRVVASLIATLFWFHPLVLALFRQLVLAQEIAADRQAATHVDGHSTYRLSLSKLAMRADRVTLRTFWNLPVSLFSHDMIRRIKMLSRNDAALVSSHGWYETMTTSMILVFALCVSTLKADEPAARVAKLEAKPVPPLSGNVFAGPKTTPWEVFGQAPGYAAIRPNRMLGAGLITKVVSQLYNSMFDEEAAKQVDFVPAAVKLVQVRVKSGIRETPEGQRNGPEKYSFDMNGDAFDVHCDRQIDWAKVSECVSLRAFTPEQSEAAQLTRQVMAAQGTSDRLRVIPDNSTDVSPEKFGKVKRSWALVDGGLLAATIQFPCAEFEETLRQAESDVKKKAGFALLAKTDIVSCGFDISNSSVDSIHVRMIVTPRDGCDSSEFVELVKRAKVEFTEDLGDEGDQELIKRHFGELQVSTIKLDRNEPRSVLVHGTLPVTLLNSLF